MKGIVAIVVMVVAASSAAVAGDLEDIREGQKQADAAVASLDCPELRKLVLRLPETIDKVMREPENSVAGAVGRYGVRLMLRKIAWCIPAGEKKSLGFRAPRASSPEEAALIAWHAAIVSGNLAKFRELSGDIYRHATDEQIQSSFLDMQKVTPRVMTISEPKTSGRGASFEAAGCVGIKPVVGSLMVGRKGEAYYVVGGWGPSWNEEIYDLHPCF